MVASQEHQRLVVWQIGEKTYLTYLTYSVFDFFASEILKWPVFNVFGVFTYLTFFIQILKCLVFNVFGVFTYLRFFASKILKCPVFSVFGVFTYLRFLQNFKVPYTLLIFFWSFASDHSARPSSGWYSGRVVFRHGLRCNAGDEYNVATLGASVAVLLIFF